MKFIKLMKRSYQGLAAVFLLFFAGVTGVKGQAPLNVTTTAVPFLQISPDARAGGMGDLGVATQPDASSTWYNLAKTPFNTKDIGAGLTYTPWLKDLGPEEFAYHARLTWPMTFDEYKARDEAPLPGWDEIPGGDSWMERRTVPDAIPDLVEPSDALPRDFALTRDDEWQKQIASIGSLFTDDELRSSQELAIESLMHDPDDEAGLS